MSENQVNQMDTSDWRQYHPVLQHRWYFQMMPYSDPNQLTIKSNKLTLGESFSNWQSSRKMKS